MIQEQISEYLGIKSFKRKYPDLMRRPVEMEERNFMMERGLVGEKMCDLGLTAVYASEILDIMCNDYPEKYEEYRRYQREKHFLELTQRQKQLQAQIENRGQQQKDRAIESAASWNSMFNKEWVFSKSFDFYLIDFFPFVFIVDYKVVAVAWIFRLTLCTYQKRKGTEYWRKFLSRRSLPIIL